MKMECITNSIFRGDVVKRGTVVDMSDAEANTSFAKANFKAVGGTGETSPVSATSAPKQSSSPAVVAGLSRDQAIAKLRAAGIAVKGNVSNDTLRQIYDNTFANVADATRR